MEKWRKVGFLLLFLVFLTAQVFAGKFFISETITVLLFLSITALAKNFSFASRNIFLPQNIAFIVFFIRLYFIPLTGIFWGYNHEIPLPPFTKSEIFLAYLLLLTSYISFLAGWELQYSLVKNIKEKKYTIEKKNIRKLLIFFFVLGFIPLIIYYNSFKDYFLRILLVSSADQEEGSKWLNLFTGFSKYFLPFSVYCLASLIDFRNKSRFKRNLILASFLIMILLFSLNSNRQSMIYPVLGLLGGFSNKFLRFKVLPLLVAGIIGLYVLMMFKEVRSVSISNPDVEIMGLKGVATDIQIYATGPHLIIPAFKMNLKNSTIFSSFFSSVPILGKPLREKSGVAIYNIAIYGYPGVAEDQVFPSVAEAFANGGILLVIMFFALTGYLYAFLNRFFISITKSDILFRGAVFYAILLFNSTLLLSFQVMGQFLFYNSIPALIIIIIYRLKNREKPDTGQLT